MRFTLSQQGSVTVIQLEGAMLSSDLNSLAETILARTAHGQPRILVDLSAVPTVDSASLELILTTQETCRSRGGILKLTGLNPLCREIFTVTLLERRFEFFDNQMTALGSFAT